MPNVDILSAATGGSGLAPAGTITFPYPSGKGLASYVAGSEVLSIPGRNSVLTSGFSVVYGASNVTLTWSGTYTIPAFTTLRLQTGVLSTGVLPDGYRISPADLTNAWNGPAYSLAYVRRKAPPTGGALTSMEADFDASGNLIRTFDLSSGRIDMWGNGASGSACVVAYAANPGADGNVLGHYAFRGFDTNGNSNTYAWVLGVQSTAAASGANSNLQFSVMNNFATVGNSQPNWAMTLRGAQQQLRFDSTAHITTASGLLNLGGGDSIGFALNTTKGQTLLPFQLAQEYFQNITVASTTLVANDAGTTYGNATAGASVAFTLPTGLSSGNRFRFINLSSTQTLVINCAGGTTIRAPGATASSTNGSITSAQQFSMVELMYSASTTTWVAISYTGTGGTANFGAWTVA